MAVRTARVYSVDPIQSSIDAPSGGVNLDLWRITFDSNGTDVAGGTDTLTVDVPATLLARAKDGVTYTVRNYGLSQLYSTGTTQVAATLTESGGVVSLTPKSTSDWSTNATITGTNGVRVPYAIVVGVTGRS
mgnify:CR=1 FL=1